MIPHGIPAPRCSACWQASALVSGVEPQVGQFLEQCRRGDFQRCTAGKSSPQRNRRIDHRIEHRRHHAMLRHRVEHASHVPCPHWQRGGMLSRQADRLLLVHQRAINPRRPQTPALGAQVPRQHRVALDRHRQHEAIVVVRVFADQVHATRGGHHDARRSAEPFFEHGRSALGQFCHRKRFRGLRWMHRSSTPVF